MKYFDNIYTFSTDVKTKEQKMMVGSLLDGRSDIEQWSVDLEDIDCVLRIVSLGITEIDIITLLQNNNFQCKPLE